MARQDSIGDNDGRSPSEDEPLSELERNELVILRRKMMEVQNFMKEKGLSMAQSEDETIQDKAKDNLEMEEDVMRSLSNSRKNETLGDDLSSDIFPLMLTSIGLEAGDCNVTDVAVEVSILKETYQVFEIMSQRKANWGFVMQNDVLMRCAINRPVNLSDAARDALRVEIKPTQEDRFALAGINSDVGENVLQGEFTKAGLDGMVSAWNLFNVEPQKLVVQLVPDGETSWSTATGKVWTTKNADINSEIKTSVMKCIVNVETGMVFLIMNDYIPLMLSCETSGNSKPTDGFSEFILLRLIAREGWIRKDVLCRQGGSEAFMQNVICRGWLIVLTNHGLWSSWCPGWDQLLKAIQELECCESERIELECFVFQGIGTELVDDAVQSRVLAVRACLSWNAGELPGLSSCSWSITNGMAWSMLLSWQGIDVRPEDRPGVCPFLEYDDDLNAGTCAHVHWFARWDGISRKKISLRILGCEPGGCTFFTNLA